LDRWSTRIYNDWWEIGYTSSMTVSQSIGTLHFEREGERTWSIRNNNGDSLRFSHINQSSAQLKRVAMFILQQCVLNV
jgi:hypothetical protein